MHRLCHKFEEHFDGTDSKYTGLGIEQLVFLEMMNGHVRCGEWKDSTHRRKQQVLTCAVSGLERGCELITDSACLCYAWKHIQVMITLKFSTKYIMHTHLQVGNCKVYYCYLK